jgi:hypothetical protein
MHFECGLILGVLEQDYGLNSMTFRDLLHHTWFTAKKAAFTDCGRCVLRGSQDAEALPSSKYGRRKGR